MKKYHDIYSKKENKLKSWQLIAGYVITTLGFMVVSRELFLNNFFERNLALQIGLIPSIIFFVLSTLYFLSFNSLYDFARTMSRIVPGSICLSLTLSFIFFKYSGF